MGVNLEGNVTYECWVSQSGFYQVLNAVNDGVFRQLKENI